MKYSFRLHWQWSSILWSAQISGKLIGGFCALSGVFILTLPIPIVVNSFAQFYKNRLWRNEVRKKLKYALDAEDHHHHHGLPIIVMAMVRLSTRRRNESNNWRPIGEPRRSSSSFRKCWFWRWCWWWLIMMRWWSLMMMIVIMMTVISLDRRWWTRLASLSRQRLLLTCPRWPPLVEVLRRYHHGKKKIWDDMIAFIKKCEPWHRCNGIKYIMCCLVFLLWAFNYGRFIFWMKATNIRKGDQVTKRLSWQGATVRSLSIQLRKEDYVSMQKKMFRWQHPSPRTRDSLILLLLLLHKGKDGLLTKAGNKSKPTIPTEAFWISVRNWDDYN